MRRRPPDDVRGTPQFRAFFLRLEKKSHMHKILKEAIGVLRENMVAGEKIEKKKWPKSYKREYGITNLFKYDLDRYNRLTYTIIAEGMKKIVCIIEAMDHTAYDRLFGYS